MHIGQFHLVQMNITLNTLYVYYSQSGAGQQCCYNGNSLLVGPPAGGTLDVVSPDKSTLGHMRRDVLPWFVCCKFSRNCEKYYQRRPSDDGSRYDPPQFGKYFNYYFRCLVVYRAQCFEVRSGFRVRILLG